MDMTFSELGSVRRQIGIVPQDSLLFDGSVAITLLSLLRMPPASRLKQLHVLLVLTFHRFAAGLCK